MNVAADGWTGKAIAHLRRLWSEGHSTAEIGRRMGISKNAVVGKAHRLNLPARPSPIRARNERAPTVRRVRSLFDQGSGHRGWSAIVEPTLPALALSAPAKIDAAPVRVGPVGECTFVMNEGRPWRYCDAATAPGRSFCPQHHALCFRPMDPRGRASTGNPQFARQAVSGSVGSVIHPGSLEEI